MRRARRITATTVTATALTLALAAVPAVGADHERLAGSFAFTDSRTCTAPIGVVGAFDEQEHIYYDSAGVAVRLAFTGRVTITYTNLENGRVYQPNSAGPSTVDLATGQTILRGGNGALFDNDATLIATTGRVVLDADNNIISLTGRRNEVCAKLGATQR
jgi:hypothetical protein